MGIAPQHGNPEDAYQTSVQVYVVAGAVGVLIWDILDNVFFDYRLLFRTRLTLSTAAYFVSRLGTLGYALGYIIFETAPIGNCIQLETITDTLYPISLGCSTLLFFFRLRAIYHLYPIIVGCFFILWLGLLASTSLISVGVFVGTIGTTKYCDTNVPFSLYVSTTAPWIYDTLVFLAISWRLFQNTDMDAGLKEGIQIAVFGKSLPTFSKNLLHDTQRYYLITFISNLAVVVSMFSTSIPPPLRTIWVVPNAIMTNIMACRIYRRTKSGILKEPRIPTSVGMRTTPRLPVVVSPPGTKTSGSPSRGDAGLSEIRESP